jgi:hypothetical protein
MRTRVLSTMLTVLFITLPAAAVPTSVTFLYNPSCIGGLPLPTTATYDEIGNAPPFPVGEQIASSATTTTSSLGVGICYDYNPLIRNAVVTITNLNSNTAFYNLWYVANPETTMANVEGTVNGARAFPINNFGYFYPGETLTFWIVNYTNTLGLSANAFSSIGVPDAPGSGASGSIIGSAFPFTVPEPAAGALLGLGLAGWRRASA